MDELHLWKEKQNVKRNKKKENKHLLSVNWSQNIVIVYLAVLYLKQNKKCRNA